MIECPFCVSEIDAMAVACKWCGRDLSGHIYLLRRLSALQDAVSALQEGMLTSSPAMRDQSASAPVAGKSTPDFSLGGRIIGDLLRYAVPPVLLLILAHHLIVFNAHGSPALLLAVSLAIPTPFGFMAMQWSRQGPAFWFTAYALTACIAVLGLNADTVLTVADAGSTIIPVTPTEWADDLEYVGSIFMSLATGVLAGLSFLSVTDPEHRTLQLARDDLAHWGRRFSIVMTHEGLANLAKYISSLGTAVSAIIALYLGLQRL